MFIEDCEKVVDREHFKGLLAKHYSPEIHSDDKIKTKEDFVSCFLEYYDNFSMYVADKADFMEEFFRQVKLENEFFNLSITEKEMLEIASAYIIFDGEQAILLHFKNEEDIVNYYMNLLCRGIDPHKL